MVLTTWILAVQQHVVRWLAHAQYVRQYIHEQLGREHAVQWVAGSIGLIPALLQQPQESCIAIRRWAFRPRTNSKGGRLELQKGVSETQGNGINDGTLYPVLEIVFGHNYESDQLDVSVITERSPMLCLLVRCVAASSNGNGDSPL